MNEPGATNDNVSRFWTKVGLVAEISAEFRNSSGDEAAYIRVLKKIGEVVAYDSAGVYLTDSSKRQLKKIASIGNNDDPRLEAAQVLDTDFFGWAVRQNKTVLLSDVKNLYIPPDEKEANPILLVPLMLDYESLGIIVFIGHSKSIFRDKDKKLLSIVGEQIALSIDRLFYMKALEAKNIELEKAHQKLRDTQDRIINDERLMAVKELAVSVNHEINNPLSVITGNVEYLLFINKGLDEKVTDRLKIIEHESLRIAEINRRLLDIQSLVSEKYVPEDDKVKMINLEKSSTGE